MIALHLRIRVAAARRDEFLTFLHRAREYYERPGGIRVRLLVSEVDPEEMIEVVEYDSIEGYRADQDRVEHDPKMRELIAEWRSLLDEPPTVECLADRTDLLRTRH